ncbi:hypothetical protein ACFTTN_14100 [Streptomyces niveus]|uniref:hypothetical protein n=1 Tax=Streptomyces niveus TaxID=193462 RepID=UPI003630EB61
MNATELIEEIQLIAEAGDAEDALDLSRRLIRKDSVKRAIDVRRTVSNGVIDRDGLRKLAVQIAEYEAEQSVRMLKAQQALIREIGAIVRITRQLTLPA